MIFMYYCKDADNAWAPESPRHTVIVFGYGVAVVITWLGRFSSKLLQELFMIGRSVGPDCDPQGALAPHGIIRFWHWVKAV